jgi:hypothetical protein
MVADRSCVYLQRIHQIKRILIRATAIPLHPGLKYEHLFGFIGYILLALLAISAGKNTKNMSSDTKSNDATSRSDDKNKT